MKKLMMILALLLIPATITAEEVDEQKYEVKLSIIFNAVNAEEAHKIISDAVDRYKEACKVDIEKSQNHNYGITNIYIPADTEVDTTLTPEKYIDLDVDRSQ